MIVKVNILLFNFILIIASVLADSIIKPCKKGDDACILTSANAAYQAIIQGAADLGMENLDPLHMNFTDGNLSGLKYKFSDYTADGLKDCTVKNTKFDVDMSSLSVLLDCPRVDFNGDYIISGRLIVLPVEGQGKFNINAKIFTIKVDAEVKKVDSGNGKSHLNIKNFKIVVTPIGNIHYGFKNLFNGQKDLADAVHKFANENWKEVANEFQGPVWNNVVKKIIKNANKYLKAVSVDELFVQ